MGKDTVIEGYNPRVREFARQKYLIGPEVRLILYMGDNHLCTSSRREGDLAQARRKYSDAIAEDWVLIK